MCIEERWRDVIALVLNVRKVNRDSFFLRCKSLSVASSWWGHFVRRYSRMWGTIVLSDKLNSTIGNTVPERYAVSFWGTFSRMHWCRIEGKSIRGSPQRPSWAEALNGTANSFFNQEQATRNRQYSVWKRLCTGCFVASSIRGKRMCVYVKLIHRPWTKTEKASIAKTAVFDNVKDNIGKRSILV